MGIKTICTVAAIVLASAAATATASVPTTGQLDKLEHEVVRAEDVAAIKRLTYAFGYYRDKFLDDQTLRVFTDDAEYHIFNGRYRGRDSIGRLLASARYRPEGAPPRVQGPQHGVLNDRILLQHTITVADDGQSAKIRFKDWTQQAVHGVNQTYSLGAYEGQLVKVDGQWLYRRLVECTRYSVPYLTSYLDMPLPEPGPVPEFYPGDPDGPDWYTNEGCHQFPNYGLSPKPHFVHPVTGEPYHKP
ncbi:MULTISPECIES: nuclear transport factor 2 family protein [unclassified Luteimonas]